ncbi:MAG: enoyl-CoA hydratase/isomerase family protein [Acetobacteraceae bacterium]|nr:enoyl-CoA hydratase/isomerase family protein [Acetobacteraceae bacterium]
MRTALDLFSLIESLPKPVIAAINGTCLGGGNELAMACDFRIAAESARFGQPEVNLGIIPGWGGAQRLLRLIGRTRALEMLMTGDMIKAADALRYGLINRVVPDNELLAHARNLARKLAMAPPLALAGIKRLFMAAQGPAPEQVQQLESQIVLELFGSEDAREGIAAFVQKRRPQFKGR